MENIFKFLNLTLRWTQFLKSNWLYNWVAQIKFTKKTLLSWVKK